MQVRQLQTNSTTDCGRELTVYAKQYSGERPAQKRLICLPGGGASIDYFDMGQFHEADYSFASIMTQKGYDVICFNHIGTCNNSLPEGMGFLDPYEAIKYLFQAIANILATPEIETLPLIGVGHSMGGMMITLLQAQYDLCTALVLMGSSAGGLEWGLTEDEKSYIDKPDEFMRDIEALTITKFKMQFPPSTGGPSGKSIVFGGETPALTQRLRDISCELYAAGGMMSMTRGSFRKDVEQIKCPVFFAFGDHDIGIPPDKVPKDYVNAANTNLVTLDNTGHNHFAFSSIGKLCHELDYWVSNLDCASLI